MVGEIDVAIVGHNTKVEFLNDHVVFRFADYRTANAFMRNPIPSLRPISKLLSFSEIGLKAQVGRRKPVEFFPKPGWIVRWLSPQVREMIKHA